MSIFNHLWQSQDTKSDYVFQKSLDFNFFSPFSVGDYVILESKGTLGDGKRHKHDVYLLGLYKIMSFKNQSFYRLINVQTGDERNAHFSLLSPSSDSFYLLLKQQEEGNEHTLEVSDSLVNQTSEIITSNSHPCTKIHRKHKKSSTVSRQSDMCFQFKDFRRNRGPANPQRPHRFKARALSCHHSEWSWP